MQQALALARVAGERGEVPVGAVVVHDGTIIRQFVAMPLGMGYTAEGQIDVQTAFGKAPAGVDASRTRTSPACWTRLEPVRIVVNGPAPVLA